MEAVQRLTSRMQWVIHAQLSFPFQVKEVGYCKLDCAFSFAQACLTMRICICFQKYFLTTRIVMAQGRNFTFRLKTMILIANV